MNKEYESVIQNIGWALKQAFEYDKRYLFYLIINAIMVGISPVPTLVITQFLVNWVQMGNHSINEGLSILALLIISELVVELTTNIFNMLVQNIDVKFNSFIHDRILRKIGRFDCKKFEKSEIYDLINRVKYDDSSSVVNMIKSVFSMFSSIVSIFSYAIILTKFNAIILVIITIFPISQYIFEKKVNLLEYKVRIGNTERKRKIAYIFELLTNSSNFKELKMYDLIGRRICTVYLGEDGEVCLFAGQYNDNYHWSGDCLICAYKNGKLLYTTNDTYNDGRLVAYKRISYYSTKNKWMYTDRILSEAGNNGDTWSYAYIDISEKEYDAENLKEEQIFTPYEVRELLKDGLISHYHGRYVDHEPNDETGDAYQIKYEKGKITEIYRGGFYDFHYITGFCIRSNKDGTYTYMIGTFHDKDGNETDNLVETEIINETRFREIILNQPFGKEVLDNQ